MKIVLILKVISIKFHRTLYFFTTKENNKIRESKSTLLSKHSFIQHATSAISYKAAELGRLTTSCRH